MAMMALFASSCYDDSALWDTVDKQEERIKTLEILCGEMNTNIKALQAVVDALKKGDYITDVTPLTENGVEVGYKITFHEYGTINLYHGKNGTGSGSVPEISVKQDSDGSYYWTVNGDWMLDEDGNRINAVSTEGSAGKTPVLKIEEGMWYVSYDDGNTWEKLGSAVSDTEAVCLFKNVLLTDDELVLELADGSVIRVPVGEPFKLVFGEFSVDKLQLGIPVEIPYEIEGNVGDVSLFVVSSHWLFETEVVEETECTGKIIITQAGLFDDEIDGRIGVFVSDENGMTVTKSIKIVSGVFYVSDNIASDSFSIGSDACQLEVTFATNRELEVRTDADWISLARTKAVEEKTLVFDVKANEGLRRKTVVTVCSGQCDFSFSVMQSGAGDFSYEFTCSELSEWEIGTIDFATMTNTQGYTVAEALGYASWNELSMAIGDAATRENYAGEVILAAYDLVTGQPVTYMPYTNGNPGYCHDADGNVLYWGESGFRCFWNMWDLGDRLDSVCHISLYPGNVTAGDVYTFGIMFKSPEGEVTVDVKINITEYLDPEKGMYDSPAGPGEYVYDAADTVNIAVADAATMIYDLELAEFVKSTLGMTTYEIYRHWQKGMIEIVYSLADGEHWGNNVQIDINGCYAMDWTQAVVCPLMNFGPRPGDLYEGLSVPTDWGSGLWRYTPSVYDAVGRSLCYNMAVTFRFDDSEPVMFRVNREISYVDEPCASKYGLVGTPTGWGALPDITMYAEGGRYVARNVVFDQEENRFKIRANNEWTDDCNWGFSMTGYAESDRFYYLANGGTSLDILVESGTYDIWFDLMTWRVFVMTPGTPIESAVYAEPIVPGLTEYSWYLVGDFNEWSCSDAAYQMTDEGDWHVFYGFESQGNELKVNVGDWGVNRGGDVFRTNEAMYVYQDGANIFVPAGTYDIYLNDNATEMYFMTPGYRPGDVLGRTCILVESSDMVEAAWDTQFWITFDHKFEEGDSWEVSMDVKADKEASFQTQTHAGIGGYIHWNCIGTVDFYTYWTTYTASGVVTSEMVGGDAITFNLNDFPEANRYFFDSISFKVNGVEQISNGSCDDPEGTANFYSKEYGDGSSILILPARIVVE